MIAEATRPEALLEKVFPKRRIEKVLLVTPPDADGGMFRFETAKRGRYANYPPYGLLVLAHSLRDIGIEVRALNLNNEILSRVQSASGPEDFDFDAVWQESLDIELAAFRPDLVGVTCMFTMTHASFKAVCERTAMQGYPVAAGGVHVTNDVDRVLDDIPSIAFAFTNEGDRSLPAFVNVVNGRQDMSALGQVIFNDPASPDEASRRQRFTASLQPDEQKISVIPAYDLIDVGEY